MRAVLDCSRLGMKMKEIKACQQVFTAAGHRPRAFFEKNPGSDSMVPKVNKEHLRSNFRNSTFHVPSFRLSFPAHGLQFSETTPKPLKFITEIVYPV